MAERYRGANRRRRVARILADGEPHDSAEFCGRYTGGLAGLRRLRELRQELMRHVTCTTPCGIHKRVKPGSVQYQYHVECPHCLDWLSNYAAGG